MKSLRKKLFLSILAVAFAVVSLATSTFAWFSMNNRVTVTGMTVTTKVSSNLMIADRNNEDDESQYGITLAQSRTGRLEPVSTVDGLSFFYTTDAKTDGSKNAPVATTPYVAYAEAANLDNATAAGKDKYDTAFQAAYGVSETITTANVIYGYIDYVFYLKATNGEAAAQELKLSECALKYNNAAVTDKAWRIAIFAQEGSKGNNLDTALASSDLISILSLSGAKYFETGKAVSGTAATSDVTELSTAAKLADIAAGATKYYKVTARLWLEGEDTSCNNTTYANLTNNYTLQLACVIGTANAAVTNISTGA